MTNLTVHFLRSILRYNKRTGLFHWKSRPRYSSSIAVCIRNNTPAGTVGSNGHCYITISKKRYLRSQLAYFYVHGVWAPNEIDHKNRIEYDDRWINLRPASRSRNMANTTRQAKNKSGFKGVFANGRQWRAVIKINYRYIHLGNFQTPKEAHKTYCVAAKKYFGEFARTHD